MKINTSFMFLFFSTSVFSEIPVDLSWVEVATANSPVAFISADDGTGRMFIVEKSGVIKVYENGVVLESPFLDISNQVPEFNEQGLLGLAFAPDYAESGEFYVYHTYGDPKIVSNEVPMRLSRYKASQNPNVADASSRQIITTIPQFYSYHNGGNIDFGADDLLYIGTGDDGFADLSQSYTNVYGKILRIDVSGDLIFKNEFGNDPACGSPHNYLIPDDNPFLNVPGACQSVFLMGLRNPWRWSFDTHTGHMFIGDVGGVEQEEVNEVKLPNDAGANLGWPCVEGDAILRPDCVANIDHLINPFFSYSRVSGQGQSVVGGYVYRGSDIPELNGTYLFNDIYREEFYFSELIQQQWQTELWSEQISSVVSYGEDENGELYFVSISGSIYKLIKN